MTHESMQHPEHHHEIVLVDEGNIFTCNGCYELGSKYHYKCTDPNSGCNFHLHSACAEASKEPVIRPPIYRNQYRFDFRTDPVNDHCYCVACGKIVTRYNYHCYQQNLFLHPSCTKDFPPQINVDNVRMLLKERLHGRCHHQCNRSRIQNTWAYVSHCGRYQYFAGCILDVRVSQHREALNRQNEQNGYQVNHNLDRGRGRQNGQNGYQVNHNLDRGRGRQNGQNGQNGYQVNHNLDRGRGRQNGHNGYQVNHNLDRGRGRQNGHNGYQVNHNLNRGREQQMLDVFVAGADFFNRFVSVFIGLSS